MSPNESSSPGTDFHPMPPANPDPALRRFDQLVGTWEMKGHTLNSDEENITGWNTFEWLPGGFFLKSEGEINFKGSRIHALEIIAYDPKSSRFPSTVYTSMSGEAFSYEWDLRGNTLIHSGLGATYTGTLSPDGNTLSGGWRPNEGTPVTDGSAYDAVMTRQG